MLKYDETNVNPKHKKTGDCVTRALVGATGADYWEIYKEQYDLSCESGYNFDSKQTYEAVLAKHGYVKMAQPRKANGKKYLVGEVGFVITKEQLDAGVFITLANHCTCAVRGGYIKDIWDCRYKTIGNYYVKSTANGSGAKYGSGEAVDSKRRFII